MASFLRILQLNLIDWDIEAEAIGEFWVEHIRVVQASLYEFFHFIPTVVCVEGLREGLVPLVDRECQNWRDYQK
jgi:hypothetical protein